MKQIIYLLLSLLVITSCLKDKPHISSGEMEDLLYDFHKAQSAIDYTDNNREYTSNLYYQAVLKKYGLTQAEFDSSMVYYLRHSDKLHKIYENLHERLSNEALSLGASVSDFNNYDDFKANGDTANVWHGDRFTVLSSFKPYNLLTFRYATDTTYHAGDKLILEFNSQFHYQDGYKNATAMLAVKYDNDSVEYRTSAFSFDGYQSLAVETSPNLKLKTISGFVILSTNMYETTTTMRLIFLSNIRLIRCHVKPVDDETAEPADSLQADSLAKIPGDSAVKTISNDGSQEKSRMLIKDEQGHPQTIKNIVKSKNTNQNSPSPSNASPMVKR